MFGVTTNKKMLPSIVKNIENIYSYTSTLHAVDMFLRSKYLYLRTAGERRIETCLGIMFIMWTTADRISKSLYHTV